MAGVDCGEMSASGCSGTCGDGSGSLCACSLLLSHILCLLCRLLRIEENKLFRWFINVKKEVT